MKAWPMALAALLVESAAARCETIRVGPGGDVATIQAALDRANAAPGDDEIRVRSGAYGESLALVKTAADAIVLSGGWDDGFATQLDDPAATVVDPAQIARGGSLDVTAGSVTVRGLTFAHGQAGESGGGLFVYLRGGTVVVDRCVVRDNSAGSDTELYALGGGMAVVLTGPSHFELLSSTLDGNRVGRRIARGAGLYLMAFQTGTGASFVLAGNQVTHNTVEQGEVGPLLPGAVWGAGVGGIYIGMHDDTTRTVGRVEDNLIRGNRLDSLGAGGGVAALEAWSAWGNELVLRRNRFLDNRNAAAGGSSPQVALSIKQGAFTDSLIAQGGGGLRVDPTEDTHLANLTIVDTGSIGLACSGRSSTAGSIRNLLLVGSGDAPNSCSQAGAASNLVGKDPGFVDRAGGDYRLAPGSIAIDAGENDPPGGLGPTDLAGQPRVRGARVDVGAYEF